jgi:hypothetical protein
VASVPVEGSGATGEVSFVAGWTGGVLDAAVVVAGVLSLAGSAIEDVVEVSAPPHLARPHRRQLLDGQVRGQVADF